jgi:hypothetical protein
MATAKAEMRAECPLCAQPHIVSAESVKRDVSEDRWIPTTLGQRLYAEWKQQKAIEAAQRDAQFTSEYQLWSMWLEQQSA